MMSDGLRPLLDRTRSVAHDPPVAFDGAGKPYSSGPSWRGAIIVMVGAIILIALGLGVIFPMVFGD
jgi:hypothetical protein